MKNAQEGYVLIEFMLSLLISAFIMSSLITVYVSMQNITQSQTVLSEIQEKSREAMSILNNDLKMAGYAGCAKLREGYPRSNEMSMAFTNGNKIQPYHGEEIKTNTNAITIRYADSKRAVLMRPMNDYSVAYASPEPIFSSRDALYLSDCIKSELARVKEITIEKGMQKIVFEEPFHDLYEKNAEISLFNKHTYFIGKTNRLDMQGYPIYALYKIDNQLHKLELIEGVEDMQVKYDYLESGRLIEKGEGEINDWSNVVGVSIMLTFSSLNAVPLRKSIYLYVSLFI